MEKVKDLEWLIIKKMIILNVVAMVVGYLIFKDVTIVIGLAFGTGIAVLNFLELSKTMSKAVTKTPAKASTFATIKYFIRFAITGITLYVAITTPHINFVATVFSLLSLKLVIYQTTFFNDRFSKKQKKGG